MAHFAQLDENNVVVQVIVVHNNELVDESGEESEQKGLQFCKTLFGQDTIWVQTSYNGSFRKNYAGGGYTYDAVRDAFIPPKPYDSWVLDDAACTWKSPVECPTDGQLYSWDESTLSWIVFNELP